MATIRNEGFFYKWGLQQLAGLRTSQDLFGYGAISTLTHDKFINKCVAKTFQIDNKK